MSASDIAAGVVATVIGVGDCTFCRRSGAGILSAGRRGFAGTFVRTANLACSGGRLGR